MKRRAVLLSVPATSLTALAAAREPEPPPPAAKPQSEVTITIHDSHGVSFESKWDDLPEIILFAPHTHIHLKISNVSDKPLTLWQPYCPDGDLAMTIEFRDPAKPDEILRSGLRQGYTAGMGFPKVFQLAPRGDLIVNVDLADGYWTMPVALAEGQSREMEVRAVYESENRPLIKSGEKELRAWTGKAVSPWHKMRLINRTGRVIAANRSVN